jgi:transposase
MEALTSQHTLTSQQAKDWREGRRLRAYELSQQGWKQKHIATALGVTPGAVSQWLARARAEGAQALNRRTSPGAPPKLSPQQKAQLPLLLRRGAPAFGFTGDVWTAARVATVIEDQWQVRYHPGYVAQLLHACGWSRQKPSRRAHQRDETAVQEWQQERLPALKKRR